MLRWRCVRRAFFSEHLAAQQAHAAKLQRMLAAMQAGGTCGAADEPLAAAPAPAAEEVAAA